MAQSFDLVIKGGTLVNHDGVGLADLGVRGGKVAAIGDLGGAVAAEVFDARGLHVLPGVIDTQVHFREPGMEAKEDLETGSRAAVMGGVTAVFEMPNTKPLTTTPEALADKVARAKNRMWCDFAFFFGATAQNVEILPEAEMLEGCAGIKIFMGSSTGDLLVSESPDVLRVLKNGRRRVSVHSEDEARLRERLHLRRPGDPSSHPEWRDPEAARMNTERLIRLAREAKRRVHVLHISTLEEIPLLAANKDLISAEATPHHLTLDGDEAYARLGTLAQMNPPVRGAAHRDAIFQAVRDGIIDILGSDHAPHLRDEKAKAYPDSPSGMTGVQTLVPIMLDHVAAGRLSLQRFVDLTSAGPQRLFDIAGKGRLAVGHDADITLVDLKQRRRIEDSWIASRCGWTPYHGRTVTGWPRGTIVRGRVVMREDELIGVASGAPVRFQEGWLG
ncbi:dihydroorotase [Neomegalonema sp.]|uniref:dihydroorotase n=1 Tax=Neomegalonema sp. TaxID=2039713 RepID=UPI002623229A|nr:dihydroorotase [Neomegalonema sp.]MDD2868887.1 dihydroorotase [Neomegalonema sp.]